MASPDRSRELCAEVRAALDDSKGLSTVSTQQVRDWLDEFVRDTEEIQFTVVELRSALSEAHAELNQLSHLRGFS